jgi:hypothetical protein
VCTDAMALNKAVVDDYVASPSGGPAVKAPASSAATDGDATDGRIRAEAFSEDAGNKEASPLWRALHDGAIDDATRLLRELGAAALRKPALVRAAAH